MLKITIAIPSYNQEKTIEAAIASCQMQAYPNKEILVIDDCSTDTTAGIAKLCEGVRVLENEKNIGIGKNLERLMKEAKGKYIVYLCGDDIFTHPKVLTDIVNQFDRGDPAIGIIGRYYYEFMDGKPEFEAVGVFRDRNILSSSCNPSGMAFRVDPTIVGTNNIFIEMPSMVKQYLKRWRWTMFEYDTVAVRIHPGGNTATKKSYYTQSPTRNWSTMVGKDFKFYPGFIQYKCRASHILLSEIKETIKLNKSVLKDYKFYIYATIAIIVPSFILRKLSSFYRWNIQRRFVKRINRGEK